MHKALYMFLFVSAIGLSVNTFSQDATQFTAHLEGFNAGGAPVATNASGQANFWLIDDGTAVRYRINVAGINNLWMAHIHVAPAPVSITDLAGPIAFWFVPTTGSPPGGTVQQRFQGNMASGVILTDTQLVGVLTPDPNNPEGTGIAGLINAMQEGRASVVIHTNAMGDPNFPPGGAGNSPPGELRGTIE